MSGQDKRNCEGAARERVKRVCKQLAYERMGRLNRCKSSAYVYLESSLCSIQGAMPYPLHRDTIRSSPALTIFNKTNKKVIKLFSDNTYEIKSFKMEVLFVFKL